MPAIKVKLSDLLKDGADAENDGAPDEEGSIDDSDALPI